MNQPDCDRVRPLLFACLENQVSSEERAAVESHLRGCDSCRRQMIAEQTLTNLLEERREREAPGARFSWLRRGAAVLLLAAGLLALQGLLHPPPAYGFATHQMLDPSPARAWLTQDGSTTQLQYTNHFDLKGANRAVTIQLEGVGTLRATGPAAFELDGAPEGWKLVLLRGEVQAEIGAGAEMFVVSSLGSRSLGPGKHEIVLTPAFFAGEAAQTPAGPSPTELFDAGLTAFFDREDMIEAEASFRAALQHSAATAELKNKALFYLSASLSRQERYQEAIEAAESWLSLYPQDDARDYVLFFHGVHHQRLGRQEEAEAIWKGLMAEFPDSPLIEHVRIYLDAEPQAAPRQDEDPAAAHSAGPLRGRAPAAGRQQADGYLVVAVQLDPEQAQDRPFRKVAEQAARHHRAAILDFDGQNFAALAGALQERQPARVLLVVKPENLDLDLHRRVLLLSAKLDDDVFPDFAFGYFTARDGAAAAALWRRTEELHRDGLSSRTWTQTFVTPQGPSRVLPNYIPELAQAAGFRGHGIGFATVESDPRVLEFVRERLPELEEAAVIDMTGNGDPQGIWLFDDQRNLERDKHWDFDPAKVGLDPGGEMPRITAADFRKLELARPVVWSGTCHSAATCRVFVEGDIVSTFGRASGTALYQLKPADSLALSILDAGAAALLAPIAANHGYVVLKESEFALEHGASLGETIKSTWDDVFLQAQGELALELHGPGGSPAGSENVMQGGGANRVLIGDPALAPFAAVAHPREEVVVRRHGGRGFEVAVTWRQGFHPKAWDMFGTDRNADWRIYARVPLESDAMLPPGAAFTVDARFSDGQGKELPYRLKHAAVESYAGRRYLHLQANGPRRLVQDLPEVRAIFHLNVEN